MIKAVLFDLDGTLIDTAPDFVSVLNRLLAEDGRPTLSEALIRSEVSNGARAMVRLGFGIGPGEPGFDDQLKRFLDRYADHLAEDTCLFSGMDQVLAQLEAQHMPWGIVTNKPERFTTPVLAGLGLAERTGPVICPDHVRERKPDPEGLLLAAAQLGLAPQHCVYVGDHLRDIEAGRRAGMVTVGARYGYISADDDPQHWHADHYIDTPEQLLALLALEGV